MYSINTRQPAESERNTHTHTFTEQRNNIAHKLYCHRAKNTWEISAKEEKARAQEATPAEENIKSTGLSSQSSTYYQRTRLQLYEEKSASSCRVSPAVNNNSALSINYNSENDILCKRYMQDVLDQVPLPFIFY